MTSLAAIAMRQAKALMDKHGLSSIDLELSAVNTCEVEPMGKRTSHWAFSLLTLVATYFEVIAVKKTTPRYQVFEFIGVEEKPLIANYTFEYLSRSIKQARRAFLKQLTGGSAYQRTKQANSFCYGWVHGVADSIREFLKGPSAAESRKINQYLNQNGAISTARKQRPKLSVKDTVAALKGMEEGSKVKLHHGVGTTERPVLTY